MKWIFVGIVILLLMVGLIPLHELGHIIMAKALGGKVSDISWLSFDSLTDSQGKYYGGWVYVENILYNWEWVLIFLGGGMFQGLVYFAISFLFSGRKFFRSERRQAFRAISLAALILGSLGFIDSIRELWVANGGIYSP